MNTMQEHRVWINLKEIIRERLSLTDDKAEDEVIDERIRGDIHMKGSNLWILMFAIFVASIGLNVNSTAVIIGAMLISPLMGPIMGIGYGAGINDFALIRRAFKNLFVATIIALLTSTLYFLISPLDTAQSELLARTTPTAWDVLIGFFGGLAGIVGATRKEKSNVIPGVAIATALMPPLCTAGFGLATGHWNYFFGAFYLYTINFVFIALSSFIVVRVFSVAEKKYVDPDVAKRAQRYIAVIVVLTMLPSSYLAYQLVGEEVFKAKANSFVNEQLNFKNTNVAQVKIDPHTQLIKVFLIGDHVPQSELNNISNRLTSAGLENAKLKVYQNGERENLDVSTLKADIVTELYKNSQAALETKEEQIEKLKKDAALININREHFSAVPKELEALFPKVKDVLLSQSYDPGAAEHNLSKYRLVLNANAPKRLTKQEKVQIEEWLKIRTKNNNVVIYIR
ncbi:MAG: TIGR00341 family protein [Sulfuricurvum sp.]|uniref:TIGR00341 family protein n=1 Tax=Sulfuricurvum sp. TaxID=2025608 RepID=UPI00261E6D83|nr:TIGR00341 family protein [Sulfuricurvum sp.]MDD2837426.1 TIGR00341 family protein [Sulfuricurvum sp.]MDD3596107.1 TIGR00341 family protein [Sulfuricurvum sp.]